MWINFPFHYLCQKNIIHKGPYGHLCLLCAPRYSPSFWWRAWDHVPCYPPWNWQQKHRKIGQHPQKENHRTQQNWCSAAKLLIVSGSVFSWVFWKRIFPFYAGVWKVFFVGWGDPHFFRQTWKIQGVLSIKQAPCSTTPRFKLDIKLLCTSQKMS